VNHSLEHLKIIQKNRKSLQRFWACVDALSNLLGKNICFVAPSEVALLGELACLSKKRLANPCKPNWLYGLGKG